MGLRAAESVTDDNRGSYGRRSVVWYPYEYEANNFSSSWPPKAQYRTFVSGFDCPLIIEEQTQNTASPGWLNIKSERILPFYIELGFGRQPIFAAVISRIAV